MAFHHLQDLLHPHILLLSDILSEMLRHEHQDVVLQSAKVISIIGDGIQKLGKFGHKLGFKITIPENSSTAVA